MARKTKKHHLDTILWDTVNHSWDAMIYSSGGTTHTVYIEVLSDVSLVKKYDKTFTGNDARQRAYDWVTKQKKYSLLPDSKWMSDDFLSEVTE